jgi:hypothetical protein
MRSLMGLGNRRRLRVDQPTITGWHLPLMLRTHLRIYVRDQCRRLFPRESLEIIDDGGNQLLSGGSCAAREVAKRLRR